MMKRHRNTILGLLAVVPAASVAQLPYQQTQLILSKDGKSVYEFSPQSSQGNWQRHDVSRDMGASGNVVVTQSLPFAINPNLAYSTIQDVGGISLLAGNCQDKDNTAQLWRLDYGAGDGNVNWKQESIASSKGTSQTNFLSASFSFSVSASTNDLELYVFGGMCPKQDADVSSWTSDADYSNTMLALSPDDSHKYTVTGELSPPIAEAGLTITKLTPIGSNSSTGEYSQTENIVLLGGHTSNAFINMSQVAIYSLPGGAWTFKGVNQPDTTQGELVRRDDAIVEPRSGHTAVLSEDRTRIIVLGGWVGDVTNPASPQLAILELGDAYGTANTWAWRIPNQNGSPFTSTSGVFGHGAVLLPGNVMMVSGGTTITQSKPKRDAAKYYYYNITSSTWDSSYKIPNTIAGAGSKPSKAGLGAGLGIGLISAVVIAIFGYLYARKRKQNRVERERRLRAMALGSGRFNSESQLSGVAGHLDRRSVSWGNTQEKQIESTGRPLPWPPTAFQGQSQFHEQLPEAERTGLDLHAPSPTRGLRRSLHSGGPAGYGNHFRPTVNGPGSVFRIDEEEEERSLRSMRPHTAASSRSDPFKDPPEIDTTDHAAQERKKEVKGWMEDWQSAAISLSRNPSQARTYSNLSQAQASSYSGSDRGRVSPEKSDRTNSNLSERSAVSDQSTQNNSTISRNLSQRSVSAGYTLFAGAAAAMGRFAGVSKSELDRSASKRSISVNGAPRYGRSLHGDNQSLLRDESPTKSEHALYFTPPESPIKDYKNYSRPTNPSNRIRARGVLGSMKRVFTGTSQVDVDAKVEHYEEKEKEALTEVPEMTQTPTNGSAIPFWQGMKGAKDWEHADQLNHTSTIRRRSGGKDDDDINSHNDHDIEDWDIETAIQQRVVQVMFTVPKEKLRVVNADTLSLISRSDLGDREDDPDWDMKRMSSLKEGDEPESPIKGRVREI